MPILGFVGINGILRLQRLSIHWTVLWNPVIGEYNKIIPPSIEPYENIRVCLDEAMFWGNVMF